VNTFASPFVVFDLLLDDMPTVFVIAKSRDHAAPFLVLSSLDPVSSSCVVFRLVTVVAPSTCVPIPLSLFASARGVRHPHANEIRVSRVQNARTRERAPSTRERDH